MEGKGMFSRVAEIMQISFLWLISSLLVMEISDWDVDERTEYKVHLSVV